MLIIAVVIAVVWAFLSCVLGFVAALGIRVRGEYPEGESFEYWFKKVTKFSLILGYGLPLAFMLIRYMFQVYYGTREAPAWVQAPVWLADHAWIFLVVGVVAFLGFAGWWLKRHQQPVTFADLGPDPDPSPALPHHSPEPAPAVGWSLDPNAPHWQERN